MARSPDVIVAPDGPPPTKAEMLRVIEELDERMSQLIGRESDGIPGRIRHELHLLMTPIVRLLLRAKRKPTRKRAGRRRRASR